MIEAAGEATGGPRMPCQISLMGVPSLLLILSSEQVAGHAAGAMSAWNDGGEETWRAEKLGGQIFKLRLMCLLGNWSWRTAGSWFTR